MNNILDYLKNKHLVWQGQTDTPNKQVGHSGYAELDELLCGGFPQHGVIDIHSPIGIGEFRLLEPLLHSRHQQEDTCLGFVAPPLNINAEMLASCGIDLSRVLLIQPKTQQEALWAAEQCLKSGCCHTVISWIKALEVHQVKRLQLAAKHSGSLHILFRPEHPSSMSLPVTLAMTLHPASCGIEVTVNKQVGHWQKQPKTINMRHQWPAFTVPDTHNVLPFKPQKVG